MAPKTTPAAPAKGISAQGRSKTYKSRGLWKIKEKNKGKFPSTPKKAKESVPDPKAPRFYPADDEKKHTKKRLSKHAPGLRASITPGTVLILLAGRFRGKRVVFLKQLPSGLLLVTGPFAINGVPLRRVNQAYVIATSTKIALPELDLAAYDDAAFKGEPKARGEKKSEEGFFKAEDKKKELPKERVDGQKKVDTALEKALDADLKGYLGARFTLQAGDRPHLLKF